MEKLDFLDPLDRGVMVSFRDKYDKLKEKKFPNREDGYKYMCQLRQLNYDRKNIIITPIYEKSP
jgi:trans-aconitate methyltransferase